MTELENLTLEVIRVAKTAGKHLRQACASFDKSRIETKHSHDYVSYVDKETEQLIVKELRQIFPKAGFITEEGTTEDNNSPYKWVIDPLDGTTNFIRNNAPYCVSIALRNKEELIIGVVYEVCFDECYSSYKKGPALLNGNLIHVSNVSNLDQAYAFLELPYNAEAYAETASHLYKKLYGKVASLRALGSAAAELCYIAAGRYDIYFEAFLGRWDFSASALILQNAGGTVTDFLGNPNFLDSHHIIGTNGPLHSFILTTLGETLPKGI